MAALIYTVNVATPAGWLYSAEQVLMNKRQIRCGAPKLYCYCGAYLDCYPGLKTAQVHLKCQSLLYGLKITPRLTDRELVCRRIVHSLAVADTNNISQAN